MKIYTLIIATKPYPTFINYKKIKPHEIQNCTRVAYKIPRVML